jgi:hypothetical protein
MSTDNFLPAAVFEEIESDEADDETSADVEEQALFWGRRTKKLAEVQLDVNQVQRSLDDLTTKLTSVLANQTSQTPAGFQLDSFSVGLALSATGKLLMIAEAGVEASVELTFTRGR